jgi:hypothetical protein
MESQRNPRIITVKGGLEADDFLKYSIMSTQTKTRIRKIGKHMAEAKAAKCQSGAPKNFITLAVAKPFTQHVRAL